MPLTEEFFDKLREKYIALENGEKAWNQEKEKVKAILYEVESNIADRYTIRLPINIGGAGIVIKVTDENLGVPQALKCARPVAGKELLLTDIIASEISRLIESSHENIISISCRGDVSIDGKIWPYYIMEYIEGALDTLEFLKMHRPDYNQIINLIKQCVEGLIFLHSKDTIHGDIKLENLLISPDGRAKISDLGSARLLTAEGEDTLLTFTRDYAHPALRGLLPAYITDPQKKRGSHLDI